MKSGMNPLCHGKYACWCFTPSQPVRLFQNESCHGKRQKLNIFIYNLDAAALGRKKKWPQ